MPHSEAVLMDCLEYMKRFHDKFFDIAVVDPPYGIGAGNMSQGKWRTSRMPKKDWDAVFPGKTYFEELTRVSTNQIIFGGNYFDLPPTRGFFIWDKGAGFRGRDFAECEMAWTSFDRNALVFSYDPLAQGDYRTKIHPTQKPIALYKWIYSKYAKPGMKIIDTHLGSGSNRIAAYDMGLDFWSSELDPDYFEAQGKRFADHISQTTLFDGKELFEAQQKTIEF